jgi:hypothetical protein
MKTEEKRDIGPDTEGAGRLESDQHASQEHTEHANQDGDSEAAISADIKQEETKLGTEDHSAKEKQLREQLGLSDSDSSRSSTPSPRPQTQLKQQPQQLPKQAGLHINKPPAKQKKTGTKPNSRPQQTKHTKGTPKPLPSRDEGPPVRTHSYPYAHGELEAFMKKQSKRRGQQKKEELNAKKSEQKLQVDKMKELDKNTRRVLTQHLQTKKPKKSSPKAKPTLQPSTPLSQRMILDDAQASFDFDAVQVLGSNKNLIAIKKKKKKKRNLTEYFCSLTNCPRLIDKPPLVMKNRLIPVLFNPLVSFRSSITVKVSLRRLPPLPLYLFIVC